MKALSLREPWLSAIFDLNKTIENRTWNTKFRGRFFLHASRGMTRAEYNHGCEFITAAGATPIPRERLRPHGIVGMATLVDVIEPLKWWPGSGETGRADLSDVVRGMRLRGKTMRPIGMSDLRWWMPDQYGFVLEDVASFSTPISCKGALGFFNIPQSLAERAERAAMGMNWREE